MEIKFKDGQLQKLDFTDNDYQKFDGVLALILNRLKRLCWDSPTIVVNYPTTIEEFTIYAIAKQLCILTRKDLILRDNKLIRLNNRFKEKRKFYFSEKDCQSMAFLDAITKHKSAESAFKPWNRVEFPLIRHDYTTIMLIALHYGYPAREINEIEYKDLKRFYVNQEVMHWDDL